jgi:hypothetical protein
LWRRVKPDTGSVEKAWRQDGGGRGIEKTDRTQHDDKRYDWRRHRTRWRREAGPSVDSRSGVIADNKEPMMRFPSSRFSRSCRRLLPGVVLGILAMTAMPTPAHAGQDTMTKESAAALKTAFVADIEAMGVKFKGLAEAFPADKYSWRPMDGVRSVSEVLMLIATEGYGFAPTSLGGKAALSREEMGKLAATTDKTQVIAHLTKALAYAKQAIEAIDPATLVAKRQAMGKERSTAEIILLVGGDMHEHLGQLIAYARMNHIVPPWSK